MIPVLLSILSAEETAYLRQPIDETVDLLRCRGRCDRRARGRAHLKERMERDRAVMSDAHSHVHGVHVLTDVVRVYTVDGESDDTDAINVSSIMRVSACSWASTRSMPSVDR